MSQFSIETATSLAFVSGIAYPITIFTVVSAAYQLKKNQSYRVIAIFLSSFFSALILLTYPIRWLPYGVPTGLRLMWFVTSNLTTVFISIAGIHRYSAVIVNSSKSKAFIIGGYVVVCGIYSAIITSNVLFVLGLSAYSTTINSSAIVIPIGHIILTIGLIARTQWKNDRMESFSTVTQIFAIFIGGIWTVCAESKTLQQAVTENPAFSALSDYQLKLRFTDYLPPHNCSLKSQTTANPQPIRTSHTPSQINTSSQPVSINPPIADDNIRLDIISTQFQSNETTSLTTNTNPAWTIADLFSSNLQNENIQSIVPMGQNFQTLHYNDEVHGGFEFDHDVNLKTHDTNSKRRLSDSSIGARKRLNENHYIDLTEGSNSIPLKVCLGRFRSSGGWAVIKLDSIYRKIINGKPLKRKITWINPSSFHFTWNDEKDYRIWIYDVSNKGYYQIGHNLKIWQILSTIENDGWNFFRKVDNSLDQVLDELKLSEYINILFEQGFTTENVVNLPQHYDKLEIKLAHRNTFDDYISRLKLTSGAKNPLQ
ncbi:hypothetical protein HDV02_001748 [Globomyces sp. JEL0801]|nr:hypothetical protein HDV02_001748 [Globomyces sp. JEL0801]